MRGCRKCNQGRIWKGVSVRVDVIQNRQSVRYLKRGCIANSRSGVNRRRSVRRSNRGDAASAFSGLRVIRPRHLEIATAKTSANAGRHRRTYRQEPGHKGGVGGAPKEARHRRREDAPGGRRTCVPAELRGVVLSASEHRLDRTARTYLSFIGSPGVVRRRAGAGPATAGIPRAENHRASK